MRLADFIESDVRPNIAVEPEADTAIFKQLVAALHHMLFQLEAGNAVDQQPADPVIAVIDGDLIALLAQHVGSGKACRTGTNDADGLTALSDGLRRLHPAVLECRLGDMFLDSADGNRFKSLLDHTTALAQPVLRADAAANLGHVVGLRRQLKGFFHTTLGRQHQPVGDVVVKRAIDLAERHTALRAARCLGFGRGNIEFIVDFVEIGHTVARAALLRHFLVSVHELQHPVRHRPALSHRDHYSKDNNDAARLSSAQSRPTHHSTTS